MELNIVVPFTSPRLVYVLDWIFKEQLQLRYRLVERLPADTALPVLYYGSSVADQLCLPDSGLLQETGIRKQDIAACFQEDLFCLFPNATAGYSLPFDPFSAVFYLLSRYEEYLPFQPDRHGRYPAADSILYREGQLELPVVDLWLNRLRTLLQQRGIPVANATYSYLPTYDIDIAWSYRYKGWKRTIGGYIRSAAANDLNGIQERTAVLRGNLKDPYDAFDLLETLHSADTERPVYFILAALQAGEFDKNIAPQHPAMQQLVRRLAAQNPVGMHPSYHTDSVPGKAMEEKQMLETITGKPIVLSRQHYIRLQLPATYLQLISLGITDDYSMGYGSHAGFRAGTSHSFYWYDLQAEEITALRVHPFCFMDATARYESGLDAPAAFAQLRRLRDQLQQCGGRLVTIFHNFSLGTDKAWPGWTAQYQAFLQER